jgi:hypothetical protein
VSRHSLSLHNFITRQDTIPKSSPFYTPVQFVRACKGVTGKSARLWDGREHMHSLQVDRKFTFLSVNIFQLSTTPWRRIGEWSYSSIHSFPLHWMEVSGQLHAPTVLPPGKGLWYPLCRRLGGPQSRSSRGGKEKNSQPLLEIEPPPHLRHHVQTGSGANPTSYPVGTGALSLRLKRPGREADHSPPYTAEVKECVELYLYSPSTSSCRGA